MRTPIAQALAYPERIDSGVDSLDLFRTGTLTFEEPNFERFPSLRLAYEVLNAGGSTSAVFNAANEIAVAAFLDHRLAFNRITNIISETLARVPFGPVQTIDEIIEADRHSRVVAAQLNTAMSIR